ncbi:PLP-dependent aminotransferase family protein [Arcobacter sp.]|uniref:MocR-like pyridoxine biosynthesis transcription factor PdxR n=1 Tax=unclassified Arcobacter TaxID=2593671 RepID=UPI003AFFADBC
MYFIDKNNKTPLHIQLYEEIKKEVIHNLKVGDKLQSIRKVAIIYNLSKTSVEGAYSQLVAEGYIDSYPKSGYFVSDTNYKNFNDDSIIAIENEQKADNFIYNFYPARLEKDSFPLKLWKRIFNKAIDETIDFGGYSDGQGEYGLRDEIAKYLIESRGVKCNASQVIVCNGFDDSLGLIIRLLNKKYDTLAIEHPGYHIARKVFESSEYKIKKIPVDKNGIDLKELEKSKAKLVYITPSHQYPTGVAMPISNRLRLLDWAEKNEALIIEDDYDSELTYETRPIPALQGLDSFDRVVYVGTFSKSLSPAIRVSYLVVPRLLLKEFNDTFESRVSLFTQKTLEKFMSEGHWERHLRKIRTLNKKKHNLMKKVLEEKLGITMKIVNQGGGLAIHISPKVSFDWNNLEKLAIKNKIKLHYAKERSGGEWQALMMGFGGFKEDEIEEAVSAFSKIWHECIL